MPVLALVIPPDSSAGGARYALNAEGDRKSRRESEAGYRVGSGYSIVKIPARGSTEPRTVTGMRTHDYLKARLRWVRRDFDAELEKLTDADLPLRPIDDMPSVAGLLVEMANKEKELIAWLQSGEWPDDDPDAFEETATLAEMRSVFASLREETLRYIDSFDEAGLEELVPCLRSGGRPLALKPARAARF